MAALILVKLARTGEEMQKSDQNQRLYHCYGIHCHDVVFVFHRDEIFIVGSISILEKMNF